MRIEGMKEVRQPREKEGVEGSGHLEEPRLSFYRRVVAWVEPGAAREGAFTIGSCTRADFIIIIKAKEIWGATSQEESTLLASCVTTVA